jgi:DNA-binding transcriptional LysR family regulator
MLINQELLRTFVTTASAASFGDAARARRVTKSAISQQIKSLEGQLGVPLFERVGRHARVTEAGKRLAEVLQRELSAIDDALDTFVADARDLRGEVRIGAPRAFARTWVRPRVVALLRQHPELRVRLVFEVATDLERQLADGRLDLAVLARQTVLPTLDVVSLTRETFGAYASPGYLAAHGEPRTAADFASRPFIAYDDDLAMHAPWWRATFGRRVAVAARIVCFAASVDELAALAEAGVGIVVLPDHVATPSVAT